MKKQKVQAKINLETLAGGAFAEKLNEALMQVAENIQNPNTDATTKRQMTQPTRPSRSKRPPSPLWWTISRKAARNSATE